MKGQESTNAEERTTPSQEEAQPQEPTLPGAECEAASETESGTPAPAGIPEVSVSGIPEVSVSGIPEVSVSAEEYDDLKKKAEERERYWNELLRTKADFENFQKRVRKERPGWEEQAVRRFILDLLPVFDNFERALEHASDSASAEGFERGVLLTHQMMERVLHDHGVEEVRAEGETFNPEFHEAVTQVEVVDRPTGTIAEVLEKGYHHRKTLLRPSKVSVATNVGDTEPSAESSRHASTEDDP